MPVVLHVDDKEANRDTVRRMLTDASYEVVEAETGAEALRLAPAGPDIVLLGLDLPDLHGLEVCRRLRADPATARLPIVHLTATYGPREMWAEALEAGADAYLTYPVEPPVLLGTVQSLLRVRAAEKAQGLAEAAYRTLFDNTLIGIARSTPAGRLVMVNAATARIFGYSSPEEMVASVPSIRHIYVDPAARERVLGQAEEGGSTLAEVPVRHRDGSTLWLSSVVRALVGPGGKVVGYEAVLQDITKRHTAEMALRASEERWRAHFKGGPTPAFLWRREAGGFVLADYNDAADADTGGGMAAFQGVAARALYPDLPQVVEDMERCQQQGVTVRDRVRAPRRTTGALRTMDLTYGFVPPDTVIMHVDDISARLEVEAARHASEHRLAAIFANTLDAIVLFDDHGRYLDANPAACALFGYSRDEILTKSAADLVPADTREAMTEVLAALREEGEQSGRLTIRRGDGATVLIEFRAVRDVQPGVHMAAFHDVTESHQASQRLELSQRQLAEAQQIAHLGSFERDLRTGAVVGSDEIFRIYGFEPGPGAAPYADFLGRTHPEDREAVAEANRRADAEGRPLGMEARLLRPDGSVRVVSIRGEVIRGEDGQPVRLVGVVQDITERKQVEEQRRALLERFLRVQEDERRNLARELHDEVGQSLTALKLMLDARPAPDTAARRGAMRKDAASIVDDLLRRIRNLSLDLRPPMLDDLGLMVALGWHLDRYRERTGIRVRLDAEGVGGRFPPDLETTAFRVVQEALTNVARHAGASEASVEVRAEPAGLVVSVADDGRGFDSVTVLATATGGLAGLRERVGLLGGHLRIASSPGAGTRLEARIPARPP